MVKVAHPAKYTDVLIDEFVELLAPRIPVMGKILDPFAGTGKVHLLMDRLDFIGAGTWGVEIEPEWATLHTRTIVGDALNLPFTNNTFDAIVTSPVYGNRMSDHHNARDASRRMTYRHTLGRALHPNNSGQLQWGEKYREFHKAAWLECVCVLKAGGLFILNVSDHIRKGKLQPVTAWHTDTLLDLGLTLEAHSKIPTPRMRRGENHGLRVEHESVLLFSV